MIVPCDPLIQICPVLANVNKGIELEGKKFPIIPPLMFANGIFDIPYPFPTNDDAYRIPELCNAISGIVDGPKALDGKYPFDEIAVAGIVPGAYTAVGNVLNNDAVGTLNRPRPSPRKLPPTTRIPVDELISIEYWGVLIPIPRRLFQLSKTNAAF
jgi:hypothetical protein